MDQYKDHNDKYIIISKQNENEDHFKKNNIKFRHCWFCDNKCYSFVGICENCKCSKIKSFSKLK